MVNEARPEDTISYRQGGHVGGSSNALVASTANGSARRAAGPVSSQLRLGLLGNFTLSDGGIDVSLRRGSERLIAFLAIRERTSRRAKVAGTLWPDSDEPHAQASLRSALSRLQGIGCNLVEAGPNALCLAEEVGVDIADARRLARRIIDGDVRDMDVAVASISVLSLDLLPDWYDDWVILEAEDWRQLRLHALEALSALLTAKGRYADAVAAALAAVRADPLRESARQALVKVHLAEHNQSEAVREFQRYRTLLEEQLDLQPSTAFVGLIKGL